MLLTVEYLRDPSDPASKCWELLPLALDLEATLTIARDGFAHAWQHLGARGFRILDKTGAVVAEEAFDGAPGRFSLHTSAALISASPSDGLAIH